MSNADRHLVESAEVRLLAAVIRVVDPDARTVLVTVHSWDGGAEHHGPATYMPHAEGGDAPVTHPRAGTECLLCEDNDGALWVPVWRYTP